MREEEGARKLSEAHGVLDDGRIARRFLVGDRRQEQLAVLPVVALDELDDELLEQGPHGDLIQFVASLQLW